MREGEEKEVEEVKKDDEEEDVKEMEKEAE